MAQLTELKIKAIKPSEKMARYYDGGGLYLLFTSCEGRGEQLPSMMRKLT